MSVTLFASIVNFGKRPIPYPSWAFGMPANMVVGKILANKEDTCMGNPRKGCGQALTRQVAARRNELVAACKWSSRFCFLCACDVFSARHLASLALFAWLLSAVRSGSDCYVEAQ